MGFYERQVLPRILNVACGTKMAGPLRRRVCVCPAINAIPRTAEASVKGYVSRMLDKLGCANRA